MIRGLAAFIPFISAVLFPLPFTIILAVGASLFEPLVPLAAGIFVDTLYYAPQTYAVPVFSLYGAIVTVVAFFVRSRLKTSIIGE
ncbi:hypothetical protein HYT04_02040 [Candidatus Kaiserbacteria bacterium]|nr:hypothetical protein [Candidatus Kaiserbacteria bacterium]